MWGGRNVTEVELGAGDVKVRSRVSAGLASARGTATGASEGESHPGIGFGTPQRISEGGPKESIA